MKVALISDLHFGIKKNDKIFQESQLKFFKEQLVDELKKRDINKIFVLGDIFDTRQSVNVQTENVVLDLFRNTFKDFEVHVIVGNHDLYYTTMTEVNSLKILSLLPNVNVYEHSEIVNFDGTDVLFLPWITDYSSFKPITKNVKYAFAHLDVTGFMMDKVNMCSSGIEMEKITDKIEHTYTGHFHSRSNKILNGKSITYIGSPYQLTRIDRGDERGCTILDLDTNETEFIKNEKSMIFNKISFPNEPDDKEKFVKGNVIDVEVTYENAKYAKKLYDYVKDLDNYFPAYPVNVKILQKEEAESNLKIESINLFSLFKSYIDDMTIDNKEKVYSSLVELYNTFKNGNTI